MPGLAQHPSMIRNFAKRHNITSTATKAGTLSKGCKFGQGSRTGKSAMTVLRKQAEDAIKTPVTHEHEEIQGRQ